MIILTKDLIKELIKHYDISKTYEDYLGKQSIYIATPQGDARITSIQIREDGELVIFNETMETPT